MPCPGNGIGHVLRLLLDLIPSLLSFTVPIATLIAMVMAFGRLSSDYELIAMRASGVAPVPSMLAAGGGRRRTSAPR